MLGMVGNLVHPETPIGDPAGTAAAIAASDVWVPIHLAIVVGITLMLGGLVALGRSVRGQVARSLARLGEPAAVAGVAVGLTLIIIDGVAAHRLAIEWAAAPADRRETALAAVATIETLSLALVSLFNLLFAGTAFTLFGLAVAASDNYPRWLGLLVVLGGLDAIAAGIIQAMAGESSEATRLLAVIGPTIITLWLTAMGLLMLRAGLGDPVRQAPAGGMLGQHATGRVAESRR
jgi:hypothetical protein